MVFPTGDFSSWQLDQASGWYRSPDGVWSYNSATFIFFHAATGGYYTYDATQQSYVSVQCEYGADGQLHVVQQPAQPVDRGRLAQALAREAQLTKPAGSLGRLEQVAVTLASLQRRGAPSRFGAARGVPCLLELLDSLDVAALTAASAEAAASAPDSKKDA